jgi:sulfate permease, SulP family
MTDASIAAKPARVSTLLPTVTAGLILGFIDLILAISLATLIFSGALEVHLSRGIAMTLMTSVIIGLFMGLFSQFDSLIARVQDNSSVLLAIAVASLGSSLAVGANPLPSVIALIVVTTLLTGVALLLIGHFHLAGLMRYIPYPVIGGFVAGTGWLLAKGGIGISLDFPLTLANMPRLFDDSQLLRWLPTLIFGVVLFLGVRRVRHHLTLPAILAAGLALFYVILAISGTSIEAATQQGLLLGGVNSGATWQPLPVAELMQADWRAVFGQSGTMATIALLVAMSTLLNISGLELLLHHDIDLNQEMARTGWANILSALGGGTIGYHTLSVTALGHRIGARRRWTTVIACGICLIALIAGTSFLSYAPKPLLGGLLLYLGLDFLHEWVFMGWKKLGRLDYAVVLLILFFIIFTDFLVGVGVGLIVMVLLFAVKYSRINIFRHSLSGAETTSHVERTASHRRELEKLGDHIAILELQGFIFFGTANSVLEHVRQRLHEPSSVPLKYLVLDFRLVSGLDSSAMLSLSKVKHLADQHPFNLVFTHLTDEIKAELARSGLPESERVHYFEDLDHGLEWCEEELLGGSPVTRHRIPSTLAMQLAELGFPKELHSRLKPYLQDIMLLPGDYLIRQGEDLSDLFFIEIGQVSVYLELDDGGRVRVQTPKMGTIVGELGFYIDSPRSASVIADLQTVAHRLTRAAMADMETKDPELAIAFNKLMLRVIAERLVVNNRQLRALNA